MSRQFHRAIKLASSLCMLALLGAGCAAIQPRTALPAAPAITSNSPHPVSLVNLLRQGGYTIYIRHTKTDFSQRDTTSDYDDCTHQRNLTDEGRTQAKDLGAAFKALGIPVGRVVASPYCRTRETAELAFGKYERAAHYDVAKSLTQELLSTPPPNGANTNTIIVAHGFILRDVAHMVLEEGDAYIFKPRSKDDQNAIARVPVTLWQDWAAGKNTEPLPTVPTFQEYDLPANIEPHDVAPASDGTVWFTAPSTGQLGRFDPHTGQTKLVALGAGAQPQGVIVGPDNAAWVTDGGLNAIVRVDDKTEVVTAFPLPKDHANADLNTAAFDVNGQLWFTGQAGIYGRLDPKTGKMDVWDAPKGSEPNGITTAADGSVWLASSISNAIAKVDVKTGAASVIAPPKGQSIGQVWADSKNLIWTNEVSAGQIAAYNPISQTWKEFPVPATKAIQAKTVYVDAKDNIWISDFGNNTLVSYAQRRREWVTYPLTIANANVRQLVGHPVKTWIEVWGAESGAHKLVVVRSE